MWQGVLEEASRLNVEIELLDAKGYENISKQRQFLASNVLGADFDGMLIGSVSYSGFNKYLDKIQKSGVTIVAMINDISAAEIDGKVLNSYSEYGYQVGLELIRESSGNPIRVAFFTGPKGVVWSEEVTKGFKMALQENPEELPLGKVTTIANLTGDLQPLAQAQLVDFVLNSKEKIDYIVANPIASQQAVKLYPKYKLRHPSLKIISTYMLPDIYNEVKEGKIYYSAVDFAVKKGEIALDLLIKILNAKKDNESRADIPFRVDPKIKILSNKTLEGMQIGAMFSVEKIEEELQESSE